MHDVQLDTFRFAYSLHGQGERFVICIHGFGQSHALFNTFTDKLQAGYQVISLDLLYHGNSSWPRKAFSVENWHILVDQLIKKHDIKRFTLVAYSLGGRFALTLLSRFAPMVEQIYLIAPDGLRTSLWYKLAVHPLYLKSIFYYIIHKPKLFFLLKKSLQRARLVSTWLGKFADHQMRRKSQRLKIYYTWTNFRYISVQTPKLIKLLNQTSIDLIVYIGRYDRVILPQKNKNVLQNIPNCQIIELEASHSGVFEQAIKDITEKMVSTKK